MDNIRSKTVACCYTFTKPESENIDKEKEEKKESLPDLQEIAEVFNKLAYSLRAYAFFFFIPHTKRQIFLQFLSKTNDLPDTDSNFDNYDLFIIDGNKYKDAKKIHTK